MGFEPSLVRGSATTMSPFRFWCQKVLPLVYDNSLSYYELLCKVVEYLNETMENVNTIGENTNALYSSYLELVEYVNTYLKNLDVQDEINNKLDAMAESGELGELLNNALSAVKTYVFIGDSYLMLSNIIPETISTSEKVNYKNYAVGGTGFVRGEQNYITQLKNCVNDTSLDKNTVTRIIITGGYNDMGLVGTEYFNENVFINAITEIREYIENNFPHAKITIIPFTWIDITPNEDFKKLHSWLVNGCVKNGVNYAEYALYWLYGGGANLNNADGVHPSDEGYKLIAENILNTINGSDNKLYKFETVSTISNGVLKIIRSGTCYYIDGQFTYDATSGNIFTLPSWCKLDNKTFTIRKYGNYDNIGFGYIFGQNGSYPTDKLESGSIYIIHAVNMMA